MTNLYHAKAAELSDKAFMTDCCYCNFSYKVYVEQAKITGHAYFSESVYDLHYEMVCP
jgi:hypothetical protein